MSDAKKPDNVVFNTETQQYDAALKPYATNVGAPAIQVTENITWKNKNVHKANKQLKAKYLELKAEYDKMIYELEYNNLVYNAKFNFQPILGEVYHLYKDKKGEAFLSIIAPNECNFDCMGSFYLTSEHMWKKVETAEHKLK
ncbi:DUF2452 domain-containing protein [Lacinutrix sp.]|uniref:DUF2452 domain-containing protein n=1 Tax=Lacinutrix sp. TaxID=1937692 RepID=UPI002603C259|nr:DUF2452 domain-containing protein [Lacinutrix sp.]MDG1715394.1 DUF2452 domain-containing protein [Lacinutrix sp.]